MNRFRFVSVVSSVLFTAALLLHPNVSFAIGENEGENTGGNQGADTVASSSSHKESMASSFSTIPNDCAGFNSPEWNQLIQKLSLEIQNNDFIQAEMDARTLDGMCNQSPILNYMLSTIADHKNDMVASRLFIQRATEYTYKFAVAPDISKKLWFTRYEKEYPQLTEATFQKQEAEIQRKNEEIEALTQTLGETKTSYQARIESLEAEQESMRQTHQEEIRDRVYTQMWTGAGIGIAGIVATAVGAVLITTNEAIEFGMPWKKPENPDNPRAARTTPTYTAGYALVGVGAALAITGAVLTGIYGYQYTHLEDEFSTTLGIAPTGVMLDCRF